MTKDMSLSASEAGFDLPITLRKGWLFGFDDGADSIVAFGSVWSGKEIVYFNNEMVSQRRKFSFRSKHQFSVQDASYDLTFKAKLFQIQVDCTLLKSGELIGSQTKAVHWTNLVPLFIALALAGFVIGVAAA